MSLFDQLNYAGPMSNDVPGLEKANLGGNDLTLANALHLQAVNEVETGEAMELTGLMLGLRDLDKTLNGLFALEAQATDAQKDGGFTRREAAMFNSHLESLAAVVGVEELNAPALESFGGTNSRQTATIAACEAAKEWFSKIWARITAFLDKLQASAINFWRKLTDQGVKLNGYAAKVKAKAEKLGDTQKEKEVTFKGTDVLAVNGVFKGGNDLVGALKVAADFLDKDLVAELKRGADYVDAVTEYLGADVTEAALSAAMGKFQGALGATLFFHQGMTKGTLPNGKQAYIGEHLPGNKALVVTLSEPAMSGVGLEAAKKKGAGETPSEDDKKKATDAAGATGKRTEILNKAIKSVRRMFADPTKLATAPKAEMEKQAPLAKSQIQDIASVAELAGNSYVALQKENDKVAAALKALVAKGKGKNVGDAAEFAKEIQALCGIASSAGTNAVAAPMSAAIHIVKVMRAGLGCCEVSLGAWE